ncbi:hypothetical protein Pint_29681 [Pistacia integerrima]|uniref:Uncharacterized protein n=1 Tax=Pistacia integerrima TaxID=434235 RepID=A0ACC0X1X1_9ROSI|nr:hypothetical protein Pint_29681 [Pistacia integerrima]
MRKESSKTAHKQFIPYCMPFQDCLVHFPPRFPPPEVCNRHFELVKEIIELHPKIVKTVNKKLETPLHEACRQGRADAVMLLLETKLWVASKLNYENESAFFIACRQGHLAVLKLMMNQSWLTDFEEDGIDLTALHVAAAMGHTGYLEITRLFLRLDQDLALQYNDKGYTPLHLAAIHGKVPILEEFRLSSPTSFQYLTKEGETVCHLAVSFNQYDALVCLANFFISSDLLLKKDQCGNTILHLAVSRGNYQLAMYIVNTSKEILNCRNNKGHTVLEILELSPGNAESKQLKKAIKAAAGNGCELPLDFKLGYQPEVVPTPSSSMSAKSRKDLGTNSPGGVFQEGLLKGKSTVGRTTAFKVFTVMWVAVSFMAIAYFATTWVTMPHCRESGWMFEVLLAISAGTIGTMFVYLAIVLTRHWLRKLKWREEKGKRRRTTATLKVKLSHNMTELILKEKSIQNPPSQTLTVPPH